MAHEAAASCHRSLALGLYACENGEVGAARSLLRESIDLAEVEITKPRPPEPPSQRPFWRSGWATVRQR